MAKKRNYAEALDHVLYEIEMLTHALIALAGGRGPLDSMMTNLWIEVFAIHARNLNEFFDTKSRGGAYMRPSDFVTWQYDYTENVNLSRRASAHVSHLTYDREVPGKKTPWQAGDFFVPLQTQSVRFLTLVTKVDEYMEFQRNRERTVNLLQMLSRISVTTSTATDVTDSPNAP